jgi:hypothetical protein
MRGLVPRIHVFATFIKKDVDGRDKPGHDGICRYAPSGAAKISAQYTLYFEFGV